ncbi:unnamed protein product [Brassica rapa subsp. trilocularis]
MLSLTRTCLGPLLRFFGNSYTFRLKLKDFNFTSKHQTFTRSLKL